MTDGHRPDDYVSEDARMEGSKGADLRDALLRALRGGVESGAKAEGVELQRVSLDFRVGDALRVLTVSRDGSEVHVQGLRQGELDAEEQSALRQLLLIDGRQARETSDPSAAPSSSMTSHDTQRFFVRREASSGGIEVSVDESSSGSANPAAGSSPFASLGRAIGDLETAVVRMGVEHADGAISVEDAFRRVDRKMSKDHLGVQRWLGRLREGVSARDVRLVARALEEAGRFRTSLSKSALSKEEACRIDAWTTPIRGDAALRNADELSDRELVEIGRERLMGAQRQSLERRYLIDTQSGSIYREDLVVGQRTDLHGGGASVGPSPRTVFVGLGQAFRGPEPLRLKLFQYAVSPIVSETTLQALSHHTLADFSVLRDTYVASLRAYPSLSEPFAFLAPTSLEGASEKGQPPHLRDARGNVLPLWDDGSEGEVLSLLRAAEAGSMRWIGGRLIDVHGCLCLRPVGAGIEDGSVTKVWRSR